MLDGGRRGGAHRSVPAPHARAPGCPEWWLPPPSVRQHRPRARRSLYAHAGIPLCRAAAVSSVKEPPRVFTAMLRPSPPGASAACAAAPGVAGKGGRTGHHCWSPGRRRHRWRNRNSTSEGQWAPVCTREYATPAATGATALPVPAEPARCLGRRPRLRPSARTAWRNWWAADGRSGTPAGAQAGAGCGAAES